MKARLGLHLSEDAVAVGSDVRFVQGSSGRHVLPQAGREIVENVDVVTVFQQRLDEVRADETRAPVTITRASSS